MITTINVKSGNNSLTLDLKNPHSSGYIVSGISGLEPVNVDIKQTQLVSGLKYKYNKGFYKYREIKINIIYDEYNYQGMSIDALREALYAYFNTNTFTTLFFTKDNNEIRSISGWVEKHQATYFSNACGAIISIICPDPWFRTAEFTGGAYKEKTRSVTTSRGSVTISTNQYSGTVETGFILDTRTTSTTMTSMSDIKGHSLRLTSISGSTSPDSSNETVTGRIYIDVPSIYPPGIYDNDTLIITSDLDKLSIATSRGVDCMGWLNAASISQRIDLPRITPLESNQIEIAATPSMSTFRFEVSYKELHKGL